jgi:Ca2+-binding EF-hand superfamily protein
MAAEANNFQLPSSSDAGAIFDEMDVNGGGEVLFDEFCKYVAMQYIDSAALDAAYEGTRAAGSVRQELASAHKEAWKKTKGDAKKEADAEMLRKIQMQSADQSGLSTNTGIDAFAEDVAQCKKLLTAESLHDLWKQMDFNKNGHVSLAEVDKLVVSMATKSEGPFKNFDNKPALMRAFKVTCGGTGSDSDLVEPGEFPLLVRNLFFYDRLWDFFDAVDGDDDRRINKAEFELAAETNNFKLPSGNAAGAIFDEMDVNGGGEVLFDEFCKYVAMQYIDSAALDAAYEGTRAAGSVRQELASAHKAALQDVTIYM